MIVKLQALASTEFLYLIAILNSLLIASAVTFLFISKFYFQKVEETIKKNWKSHVFCHRLFFVMFMSMFLFLFLHLLLFSFLLLSCFETWLFQFATSPCD